VRAMEKKEFRILKKKYELSKRVGTTSRGWALWKRTRGNVGRRKNDEEMVDPG